MRYEKITIICTDCKKEADSWDLCHEGYGRIVAVCLKCTKEQMDSTDFQGFMEERKEKPGVDRYEII
jgi:hypothetical protein